METTRTGPDHVFSSASSAVNERRKPSLCRLSLGVGNSGRLLAFLFTLGLAATAAQWRALAALGLATVLALLLSREAFRRVAVDRTWPVLSVVAVGLGALIGERDLQLWFFSLSSSGLSLGLQMTIRAITILLAVQTLTTSVSPSAVASVLERVGFKGLGFALGVAVNALPIVQHNFQDALTALRLRGGFRRRRLYALRLLLLTSIVNSVRNAEDIVAAAEARGFRAGPEPVEGVDQRRSTSFSWQPSDLFLLAFVAVAALAVTVGW